MAVCELRGNEPHEPCIPTMRLVLIAALVASTAALVPLALERQGPALRLRGGYGDDGGYGGGGDYG